MSPNLAAQISTSWPQGHEIAKWNCCALPQCYTVHQQKFVLRRSVELDMIRTVLIRRKVSMHVKRNLFSVDA